MPQSLIVIPRRSLVAGLLLFAALAALATGARAEAASGAQEPRIVAVEGFAFQPNHGEGLRVAALVLSRYPEVEAGDYPKRLRKHLRFRAHAKLDVFDGAERIARGREAESLPVAAKRHSLRFVHLILFSRTESAAILAAADPQATPARGLDDEGPSGGPNGADEPVKTTAHAALEVIAEGDVVDSSRAEEKALLGLSDEAPPRVVNGCVIAPETRCYGVDLRNADLDGADLEGADLRHSNLSGANLSGADLSGAESAQADFSGANLHNANLFYADFDRANLAGADLSGANLSHSDLSGADLSGAELSHADFYRTNLSGAELFGADLSGVTGQHANFKTANLTTANLRGTQFEFTWFNGAQLYRADLTGAAFAVSWFNNAGLAKANFTNARLLSSDLRDTDRWGTIFTGTEFYETRCGGTLVTSPETCRVP